MKIATQTATSVHHLRSIARTIRGSDACPAGRRSPCRAADRPRSGPMCPTGPQGLRGPCIHVPGDCDVSGPKACRMSDALH